MTENEIITAWKCCSNVITSSCKECPLHITHNANCVIELMRVSLDLYNRQKAENERLQKEAERWKNAMMGECMLSACPNKEQLKSEAYREFADRLKDVPSIIIAGQKHYVIVETYFDTTLKELTEK